MEKMFGFTRNARFQQASNKEASAATTTATAANDSSGNSDEEVSFKKEKPMEQSMKRKNPSSSSNGEAVTIKFVRPDNSSENKPPAAATTSAQADNSVNDAEIGAGGLNLNSQQQSTRRTRSLALACEVVGAGAEGDIDIVARVTIINSFGYAIYDEFVYPTMRVTDFRTAETGIRFRDLIRDGQFFKDVRLEVADIIWGHVLVGHDVDRNLGLLALDEYFPVEMIRDTSEFVPFRKAFGGSTHNIRKLAAFFGIDIPPDERNPEGYAWAAMQLYKRFRSEWESAIAEGKA